MDLGKVALKGLSGLVEEGLDASPHGLDDLLHFMKRMVEVRRALADLEGGEELDTELSRLIDLEIDLLRKTADAPATSLSQVLRKLAIWCLAAEDHDEGQTVENALVRSVIADLHRLDGRPPRAEH